MDLIKNGAFDFPTINAAQGYTQFQATPPFAWSVAWTNGATNPAEAEVQKTPQDGQYCELASQAPYQISQVINPDPDQYYVFSFRAKARQGYPSPFTVRLQKSDGMHVEYHIKPEKAWKTYSFCQRPGAREVKVTFVGTGTGAGGAFIDDVRYAN